MQVKFIRSKQRVRKEEENKALGLEKVAWNLAEGKEKEGMLWLKCMINTSVYTWIAGYNPKPDLLRKSPTFVFASLQYKLYN